MKKIISLITAFVMSGTLFLSALPAGAEETALSEGQSTLESGMQVESTNSFGDLLTDKITAKNAEQQANNGCNIFSAEVTGNQAVITFETLRECTLIAAVYDESGTQLLASGSEMVEKGEKEKTVTIDIETMPQYFYFKAFLVDMSTLKPISTVYECPNYTQEMQEFFAKTVEDFDEEKVLNLDDNNSTNFAVFGEDTKIITTDGVSNKVTKADDANQQYIFENADETMTSLKAGDIFAYEYENKEILIVKVGKIEVSGATVTITGEDTSLENVFEYVKIETESDMSDATVDTSNLPEGVTCKGVEKLTETDSPKALILDGEFIDIDNSDNGVVLSLPFEFGESVLGDEDKGTYAKVSGNANLSVTVHFRLYISTSYQHCSLTADYDVSILLAIEGQAEGSIPLGTVAYTPVVGVTVKFTPSLVARVSAKIEIGGSLTGRFGFEFDSETGNRSLCESPEFKPVINMEGTFFVGLALKPELDLVGKYVAEASITAELGVEITAAAITEPQETATKRHSCVSCIDGDFSAVINLDAKIKFLKLDKLEFGIEPENLKFKIGDFYYSEDKHEFGLGECPYGDYLVNITVKDENSKPVSGAIICRPMHLSYYAETDENGNASCFLTGDCFYSLMAKKGNLCGYKNLTVENESVSLTIILDKTLPVDPIDISFSVADKDGNPVEGAEISNDFNDETAVSDAEGKAIMNLYEGNYTVFVKAEGYSDFSEKVTVDKTNPDVTVTLSKKGSSGIFGSGTNALKNPKQVKSGNSYIAVVTEDGKLYAWGKNSDGNLGNGEGGVHSAKIFTGIFVTHITSSTPVKIMDNVDFISLGSSHSAAVTKDGSLYMWGLNSSGQLGNGEAEDHYRVQNEDGTNDIKARYPNPIKIMDNVVDVSLGAFHSAAVTKDGSLYTWGANNRGQLGDGTTDNSANPIKIMDNVKSVALGGEHSAAITKDGSLYTWGYNGGGILGNGTTTDSLTPIKVMDDVSSIDLSGDTTAAITKDGSLYTWGYGKLGNGTADRSTTPIKIMDNVVSVSLGIGTDAAITENGDLYTWGGSSKYYGQLGYESQYDCLTPKKIMSNVAYVDMSKYSTRRSDSLTHSTLCSTSEAITKDKGLYIWGYNDYSSLLGADHRTPEKINNSPLSLGSLLNFRRNSLLSDESAEENDGTKAYTGLNPNTVYNFYSLKTQNTETPLSAENILYINQYVSDKNGNLNISYEPKEEYADAVTLLTTAATMDISGAEVTVPDIICNGEEQFAQPTVTLNGVTLIEGIDYDVEKDYSTSVPGDFEIVISGTGDYSGKVSASYTATCEHNYENGVCTICGDASEVVKGDANGDGKFNIRDAAFIAIMCAKGQYEDIPECADYNEDGQCNIRDAAAIAIYLATRTY